MFPSTVRTRVPMRRGPRGGRAMCACVPTNGSIGIVVSCAVAAAWWVLLRPAAVVCEAFTVFVRLWRVVAARAAAAPRFSRQRVQFDVPTRCVARLWCRA
jgi:hypothetical protein